MIESESDKVDLTPEQMAYVVQAVVEQVLAHLRAEAKAPKAVAAKPMQYSYIPRGLDAGKPFSESFYPGWADDLAPECPVRVVTRKAEQDVPWRPSSVLRLLETDPEPQELDPTPIAVWKADKRLRQGGYWMDPETGERVGGIPVKVAPVLTDDDKALVRAQTARKWKPWTSEKDSVVLLEANMLARISSGELPKGRIVERWRER